MSNHLESPLLTQMRLKHYSDHHNTASKHCPFCIIVETAIGTYKADTNNPFAVAVLTGEAKLAHDIVNTQVGKGHK